MSQPVSVMPCTKELSAKSPHRRVVQDGADIAVLDLIKRINALDTVVEELVENEADTSTARQLVGLQVCCVTVNYSAEF
jgi:hypothetical protein